MTTTHPRSEHVNHGFLCVEDGEAHCDGTTTTFDVGEHSSLKVFITSDGELHKVRRCEGRRRYPAGIENVQNVLLWRPPRGTASRD